MVCPKCGAIMDDYTEHCYRCKYRFFSSVKTAPAAAAKVDPLPPTKPRVETIQPSQWQRMSNEAPVQQSVRQAAEHPSMELNSKPLIQQPAGMELPQAPAAAPPLYSAPTVFQPEIPLMSGFETPAEPDYAVPSRSENLCRKLPVNRSLLKFVLFSVITLGIYSLVFLHKLAADVNEACENDGSHTAGLGKYLLLNIVTCGIYSYVWSFSLAERLADNAVRYGMTFREKGAAVLSWSTFGILLFGIGPLVALHMMIKNTNAICGAYNARRGLV